MEVCGREHLWEGVWKRAFVGECVKESICGRVCGRERVGGVCERSVRESAWERVWERGCGRERVCGKLCTTFCCALLTVDNAAQETLVDDPNKNDPDRCDKLKARVPRQKNKVQRLRAEQ